MTSVWRAAEYTIVLLGMLEGILGRREADVQLWVAEGEELLIDLQSGWLLPCDASLEVELPYETPVILVFIEIHLYCSFKVHPLRF